MSTVTIGVTQMTCSADAEANIDKAEQLVRDAAGQGAQLVLLQELFQNQYFCQEENADHYALAMPAENNPVIERFQSLAKELSVVLPVSFFERANNAFFNSIAIVDADGSNLGVYRKSHIPHGYGYQEKFYFSPGDTGFKVWDTAVGCIGVGICWDQWFPECARSMALMGAEILLYPTAIGSDVVHYDAVDSMPQWRRAMQGHAASSFVTVAASNRIGREAFNGSHIDFYGSSFITDGTGEMVADADRETEGVSVAAVNLEANRNARRSFGFFRDRRPDLYDSLLSMDSGSA